MLIVSTAATNCGGTSSRSCWLMTYPSSPGAGAIAAPTTPGGGLGFVGLRPVLVAVLVLIAVPGAGAVAVAVGSAWPVFVAVPVLVALLLRRAVLGDVGLVRFL